ncbi:MAG: 4Fe-4S single cluster domain-containing protein [Planctomycetota bacterium]
MKSLNVAHTALATRAEGPGLRMAVWVQGCPLRCPECCNPEMLPFEGGSIRTVDSLIADLERAMDSGIEGITLLGGEPFSQADELASFAESARQRELSVMVFSGFTLAQLRSRRDPGTARLLAQIDLLVDGPFLKQRPDRQRRWVGSANQQIHFLTERYRAEDDCWNQPNTIELRLIDGELHVNGFPT